MDAQKPSLFTNLLALAGSAIVIAILIWGIVYFTGWSVGKLSTWFKRDDTAAVVKNETPEVKNEPKENVTVPAPKPGTPDLYVQILRTGMTGPNEAYVVFDIANRGTAPSGAWYFTAQVPTTGQSQYYVSPIQASLVAGAHIENTLRFSPLTGNAFTVTVDPDNRVKELNDSNNTASQYISVNYYPTSVPYYGY